MPTAGKDIELEFHPFSSTSQTQSHKSRNNNNNSKLCSSIMAQVLTISPEASTVSFYVQELLPIPKSNEVFVRFLAAPINPLDILVLENAYPVKPQHSYLQQPIPGYDGVAKVISCGTNVSGLSPGDLVIPRKFGAGTWRTHAVLDFQYLQKISAPTDPKFAAILRISIGPAFCLVEDMRNLKPGDYIIQNAGTSVMAQMVAQFAHRRGVSVINVIRDRPNIEVEVVKNALYELGVDMVLTDSEMIENDSLKNKRITLALDSVFGPSGRSLVKALSVGGTYVQLGFLGGREEQIRLDASDLFMRQLTLKAFRGSSQVGMRTAEEQCDLFNWFVSLFNRGELRMPPLQLQEVTWDLRDPNGSKERLLQAVRGARNAVFGQRKQIIVFK